MICDVTGNRFGRLTAISLISTSKNGARWLFECDCGRTKEIRLANVKNGHTQSCGCEHSRKSREANTTHNMSRTAVYKVWASMIGRCCNPSDAAYPYYGARGISVSDKWKRSFICFLADVGPRPSGGYSIERLNNDGDYEPGNCVWIRQAEQAQNTRRVRRFSVRGSTMTIRQLSQHYGIPAASIIRRLEAGWTIERSVLEPLAPKGTRALKKSGEAA